MCGVLFAIEGDGAALLMEPKFIGGLGDGPVVEPFG
jgi:hypothetical protein